MNKLLNTVTGWLAFGFVLVLSKSGAALSNRTPNEPMITGDWVFLALVVGAMFFLQYALERYLLPPDLLPKERRKTILEGSWAFYRRGAIGISYFFLVCYAVAYISPRMPGRSTNWIMPALFFLILGMAGAARGIILHLAQPGPANRTDSTPVEPKDHEAVKHDSIRESDHNAMKLR